MIHLLQCTMFQKLVFVGRVLFSNGYDYYGFELGRNDIVAGNDVGKTQCHPDGCRPLYVNKGT